MSPSQSNTPIEHRSAEEQTADPAPAALRIRYRIRFAKTGLLRWISHRDLARLWERLVRRADLKLSMTEGFHPKPRIAFPSALALGVESWDEVVELDLAEEPDAADLFNKLASDEQPGLTIVSVCRLPDGFGKAQLRQTDYHITIIDEAEPEQVQLAIDRLLEQEAIQVSRKGKQLTFSVREQIRELRIHDRRLHLTLAASEAASLRPGDVLDALGLNHWIEQGASITRTRVVLQREIAADDPLLFAREDLTHATARPPREQPHG